jgi:hypothetical protein
MHFVAIKMGRRQGRVGEASPHQFHASGDPGLPGDRKTGAGRFAYTRITVPIVERDASPGPRPSHEP